VFSVLGEVLRASWPPDHSHAEILPERRLRRLSPIGAFLYPPSQTSPDQLRGRFPLHGRSDATNSSTFLEKHPNTERHDAVRPQRRRNLCSPKVARGLD